MQSSHTKRKLHFRCSYYIFDLAFVQYFIEMVLFCTVREEFQMYSFRELNLISPLINKSKQIKLLILAERFVAPSI